MTAIGVALLALGGLVALWHFYLSFLRMPLLSRLGRNPQWISGIPLLGTVLLVSAALILRDHPTALVIALILMLADTCGLIWFLVAVVRDFSARR